MNKGSRGECDVGSIEMDSYYASRGADDHHYISLTLRVRSSSSDSVEERVREIQVSNHGGTKGYDLAWLFELVCRMFLLNHRPCLLLYPA